MQNDDYRYLKSLANEMITKEKWTWFMNGKLRVEMHTGYKVFCIEDIWGGGDCELKNEWDYFRIIDFWIYG